MTTYQEIVDLLIAPGGGFDMEDIEVDGVPMRAYKGAAPNVRAVWEMASLQGDKPYVIYEDEKYTYADIDAMVKALAYTITTEYGVQPGDRVALAMRNYPEWVAAYWGVVAAGATVVALNAWWTGPEMQYGIEDSAPKLIIADSERLERLNEVLDEIRAKQPLAVIAVRHEGDLPEDAAHWNDVVDPSVPRPLPELEIDPDSDATIFYTSGTTGFPKGAQQTHRNVTQNLMNMVFIQIVMMMADPPPPSDDDPAPGEPAPQIVAMVPTPLFHVTACNCNLHPITMAGGCLVFTHKWDAGRALELMEREKVQRFLGVPVMLRDLLNHPDFETRDLSALQGMSGGGAQVQPDLARKIEETGGSRSASTGYGLTEVSGIMAGVGSKTFLDKPESVGPAMPNIDVKLVDASGADVEPGPNATGELCARGPVVIKGYLNKPEATANAIRDGWFRTGDIARIDEDGFIYIVDRAKDMVLRGGENVYCAEVESAIFEHPEVVETVVFSVPDERLGEAVGACIVVDEGSPLDAEAITAFAAERIAKFKVPEHIWIQTDRLPQNASGKFLKREVRAKLVGAE